MSKEAMKLALEALEYIYNGANNQGPHTGISWRCVSNKAEPVITALREALAEQPAQQEPLGPEPFGYFHYDIRLDAWVQNRVNNKGAAFYTAGDIQALKHRIHDQDAMLERQTARIVDLQTHIKNLEGEE